MTYRELKDKHQNEYNEFFNQNGFAAFSDNQFFEGIAKLALTKTGYAKHLVHIGAGCFLKKEKHGELVELFRRQREELKQFQSDEKSLIASIVYELGNHEYCITSDETDAVNALDLDMSDEPTRKAVKTAIKEYNKTAIEW